MVYVIMGVSGTGKTTIGNLLAQKLRLPFYDADDFHPADNIAKMNKGIPLTDADREGWLKSLAALILQWEVQGGAVLACSALKEEYRATLRSLSAGSIQWIFLKGEAALIQKRLASREDHFMNPDLLQSQFQILEIPSYAITVDVDNKPQEIVETILRKLDHTA